jgi:hypothetical protein
MYIQNNPIFGEELEPKVEMFENNPTPRSTPRDITNIIVKSFENITKVVEPELIRSTQIWKP